MEVYIPDAWVIDSLKKKEAPERPGLYLPVPEPLEQDREEKPETNIGNVIIIQL
jgi:hypothetical protein